MKEKSLIKILPIVRKNKMLRTLSILSVVFLIIIVAVFAVTLSYKEKTQASQSEIEKNLATLEDLQDLIQQESESSTENDLSQKKSFAEYEEVIPFITFLESLFSVIDPKTEITIKSHENQIFIDHFADYQVLFKAGQSKELFFKALEELHDSRFITHIINFELDYKPAEDGQFNKLNQVELVIRLFLK